MASPDDVNIKVLRESVNRIFDFIEKDLGISEVQLKHNYYWSIAHDVLYAMQAPPDQLDVGSLKDDWDFVLSASKDEAQQIPILFIHLAPLLYALSQAVPNYAPPPDNRKKR